MQIDGILLVGQIDGSLPVGHFPFFLSLSSAQNHTCQSTTLSILVRTKQVWVCNFEIGASVEIWRYSWLVLKAADLSAAISLLFPEQVKGFRSCVVTKATSLPPTSWRNARAASFMACLTFFNHNTEKVARFFGQLM